MKLFISMLLLLVSINSFAQKKTFSHADTLRGSNGPFRERWDVMQYDLTVEADLVNKSIKGKNIITFFDNGAKLMQIGPTEQAAVMAVIKADAHGVIAHRF